MAKIRHRSLATPAPLDVAPPAGSIRRTNLELYPLRHDEYFRQHSYSLFNPWPLRDFRLRRIRSCGARGNLGQYPADDDTGRIQGGWFEQALAGRAAKARCLAPRLS